MRVSAHLRNMYIRVWSQDKEEVMTRQAPGLKV